MLVIQCTKKLGEELKINLLKGKPKDKDEFFSWHANLFLYKRKKYVLVMNNVTRYNFILEGMTRDKLKKLDQFVVEGIIENLKADGIRNDMVEKYAENCDSFIYTATDNRAILSQITEMISTAIYLMDKNQFEGKETNIFEMNRFFNRFVMLKLPHTYSGETMRLAFKSRWGEN